MTTVFPFSSNEPYSRRLGSTISLSSRGYRCATAASKSTASRPVRPNMEEVGVGSICVCGSCIGSSCSIGVSAGSGVSVGSSMTGVSSGSVISPSFCRVSSVSEHPAADMTSSSARIAHRTLVRCFFVRNKIRSLTGGPARLRAAALRGACARIARA